MPIPGNRSTWRAPEQTPVEVAEASARIAKIVADSEASKRASRIRAVADRERLARLALRPEASTSDTIQVSDTAAGKVSFHGGLGFESYAPEVEDFIAQARADSIVQPETQM